VGAFAPTCREHIGEAAEGRKMGLGLLKIHHGFWVENLSGRFFSSGLKLIVCNPSSVLLSCAKVRFRLTSALLAMLGAGQFVKRRTREDVYVVFGRRL
jgi:hypothetical protein